MADTIITVQGEYELRHPAERGAVRLRVAYDGPSRDEVLALATQRQLSLSNELRDLHNPQSGPVTQWSSDQLRVWGERPWSGDERRLDVVHHAEVGLDVLFSDLAALSDWVGVASLLDGVNVDGVIWSLTEARRQSLTQEARRRAVENAVAKATVYATSLGLSAVKPLALSDPGMLGDGAAPGQPPQPLAARAASSAAGGATLSLKPEELTIAVQVHARFSAS
jgi:hypothetical protein